jgi:hypothetical protein
MCVCGVIIYVRLVIHRTGMYTVLVHVHILRVMYTCGGMYTVSCYVYILRVMYAHMCLSYIWSYVVFGYT